MTYARTDDIRGQAVGIAQGDQVFKSEFARTVVATSSFVESLNRSVLGTNRTGTIG